LTQEIPVNPGKITKQTSGSVFGKSSLPGQLASVSLGAPHADAGLVASFTYDPAGRGVSRAYGNNLQTLSGYSRANNLITSITVPGKPELSFNYSYDSNKNVTAEQRGGSMALYSWNATFNAMDRLNSQNDGIQTRSWSHDLVGNTTSETIDGNAEARTLNAMHAPTAAGNKAYAYDNNGQMTSKPGYTLVWDARNHLSTGLAGILPGPVAYRYDAFGNRVSKGSTRYLLVDNQVVAEFTGSASKQYCYGSYIDEVLAEQVVTPSLPSYYHRNRQYNTVALTDAVGAIVEQYSTDAMGRVKAFDAAAAAKSAPTATTVLFTGRVWDVETGLYYFRARYFEPELGVFISRDPLGFVDGKSVYQGWHVTRFRMDPTGLEDVFDEWTDWWWEIKSGCKALKSLAYNMGTSASDAELNQATIELGQLISDYTPGVIPNSPFVGENIPYVGPRAGDHLHQENYFNTRWPKTIAAMISLINAEISTKICQYEGQSEFVIDFKKVVQAPEMWELYGDSIPSWYGGLALNNNTIGGFSALASKVKISSMRPSCDGCCRVFRVVTEMQFTNTVGQIFWTPNVGGVNIPIGLPERDVIMAEFSLIGDFECCGRASDTAIGGVR
jgi:RHS repeat-associated protein